MSLVRWHRISLLKPVVVGILLCTFATSLWAQYKEFPLGERMRTPTGIRQYRMMKSKVLQGTEPFAQRREEMLEYYKQYWLPALTR